MSTATWWTLTVEGEPSDDDREQIANLIRGGFTSGQLVPSSDDDCLVCGAPCAEDHGESQDPETGEWSITCPVP